MSINNPFKRAEKQVVIKVRWEKKRAHIMDLAVNPDWSLLAIACVPDTGAPSPSFMYPSSDIVDPETASFLGMDSLRVGLYKIPTGEMLMKVSCCQNHHCHLNAIAALTMASLRVCLLKIETLP